VLAAKYKMKRSDVLRGIVRELERRPALIEDMFGHLQPKGDWLWLESQKP
jgi:hypothetical protein